MKVKFSIYRYNNKLYKNPCMKDYTLSLKQKKDVMLLDALIQIKEEQDPSLSFRRSCREGVCGSDGMNINGKNMLACITPLSLVHNKNKILIRPLPGLPIIRDLIVDMSIFHKQFNKIKPYIINDNQDLIDSLKHEYLQSPEDRSKIDGSYECILCGCCSSLCPSFWWNPDKFIGPAGLLAAYRFIIDSRDTHTKNRLEDINDSFSLFRCRGIMNCTITCPKKLNPSGIISKIKRMLLKKNNLIKTISI